MKTNIVYELRDPRNDVYYYIGKSSVGNRRALSHLKHSHSEYVNNWILELKNINIEPVVDIIETVYDLNDLADREKYWINFYKNINPEILNIIYVDKSINSPITKDDDELFDFLCNNIENIYKILRKKRKYLGITTTEASMSMGISRNTLFLLEKENSHVSFKNIIKYVKYLKMFEI